MAARTGVDRLPRLLGGELDRERGEPLAEGLQGIRFGGPLHGGEDGRDRLARLLGGELWRERGEPLAEGLQGIEPGVRYWLALTASASPRYRAQSPRKSERMVRITRMRGTASVEAVRSISTNRRDSSS